MSLELAPLTVKRANRFVRELHRHSDPVVGCKFAIGCLRDGLLVGVSICGRPVCRELDDGYTMEVLRVCTDGTFNACSFLYGASRKVGRAMGYRVIITYTLKDEPGTSLLAVGAKPVGLVKGRQWDTPSRPRAARRVEDRIRWEL
jgi:hypothetical protein